MHVAILFGSLAILMMIGVPIGLCLIIPCMLVILSGGVSTSMASILQCLYSGAGSFTMLAIPFFMISGTIMDVGGLSKRLVRLANSIVGNVTGSLGMVTVLACMFFGAVSGSAPATCAAIGAIMIPEMIRAGYNKYYAAGLVACAGGLGIIVPPSYPMVIYAVTNNESIGDLFMAGFIPALLIGVILMLFNYFISKKNGWKGTQKFSMKEFLSALWDAKWAILMPVIILGGIYSGIFTATEAAVVATVYGLFVGCFIYKAFTLKSLWKIFADNMTFNGGLMLTVAPATALGTVFAYMNVTTAISEFFASISTNYYVIMSIIYVILFIIGMFIQTTPAIVIFSPVLLAVGAQVGLNPLHFGIVMVVALAIAFVTPPVAANLFVASSLTGLSMDKIVKAALPFLLGLIISLVIIGFVPEISTFLPDLLNSLKA
ncbi:MAG: TRAP transporter large permease [Faecalibacterium sp.]|nr:TRAP transporter large permease [Faecalibacterium sp.]